MSVLGDGLKKVGNGIKGYFAKLKNWLIFLFTPTGHVLFWILLILSCVILLYVLVNSVIITFQRIFGIESGKIQQTADYAILQQLARSGYNSLLDSEKIREFVNYEYDVMIDAARYFKETGVIENMRFSDWVAEWEPSTEEWKKLKNDFLDYTYSDATSKLYNELVEKIKSTDDYIRYANMKDKNNLTPEHSSVELFYKVNTMTAMDGAQTAIPYLIVRRDATVNTYFVQDETGIVASNGEVLAGHAPNTELFDEAIINGAYYYNSALNAKNSSIFGKYNIKPEVTKLSTTADYSDKGLFYRKIDNGSRTYEIPFKLLVDRFLPKETLLSAWYALKDGDREDYNIDELIDEIKLVYDYANMYGETQKNYTEWLEDNKDLMKQKIKDLTKEELGNSEISDDVLFDLVINMAEFEALLNGNYNEEGNQIYNVETGEYNPIYIESDYLDKRLAYLYEKRIGEKTWDDFRDSKVYTNTKSFITFERVPLEFYSGGTWEDGPEDSFVFVTDLLEAISIDKTSAGLTGGRLIDGDGNRVTVYDTIYDVLGNMMVSAGFTPLSGKGVIVDLSDEIEPPENPQTDSVDISGWYYMTDSDGNKKSLENIEETLQRLKENIRYSIYTRIKKLIDNKMYTFVSNADDTEAEFASSNVYVTLNFGEPKAIFKTEEIIFDAKTDMMVRKMPAYFPAKASTWSRDISFNNYYSEGDKFVEDDIRSFTNRKSDFFGMKDMKISENSKWRTKLFSKYFKAIREKDVILMMAEWEKASDNGVFSADTYIRDLYKLLQYSKEDYMGVGVEASVDENNYVYLNIPDEIMYYDETTTDFAYWMQLFLATEEDPIMDDEIEIMQSRIPTMKWQQVDYSLYPECYDEETGNYKVYALWPEGSYLSKSNYSFNANASGYNNRIIESWGGWMWNGSHAGVDIFGRDTSQKILNTMKNSSLRTEILRDGTVVLKADKGDTIGVSSNSYAKSTSNSDGEAFSQFYKGENFLYAKTTPITIELDGKKYTFSDSVSAVYGYELYRLTKALNDPDAAKDELIKVLEKESTDTPVVAVAPGIVTSVRVGPTPGFGVTIEHTKSNRVVYTNYVHLKRYPLVQEGEYVGAGTIIGYEGTTGGSQGLHVHFEVAVTKNGVLKKGEFPIPYLYPFFTPFYRETDDDGKEYPLTDGDHSSLIRTVYPNGQIIPLGNGGKNEITPYQEDGEYTGELLARRASEVSARLGYFINQVRVKSVETYKPYPNRNEEYLYGYLKLDNYVPTKALLDDYTLLPTIENQKLDKDFLLPANDETIESFIGKIEDDDWLNTPTSNLNFYINPWVLHCITEQRGSTGKVL